MGYQIHTSGSGPTSTWGTARANYFDVGGIPDTWVDGAEQQSGALPDDDANYNNLRALMNARLAVATEVTLELGGVEVSGQQFEFTAELSVDQAGTEKTLRVHLVEARANYPSSTDGRYNNGVLQGINMGEYTINPGEMIEIDQTMTLITDTGGANADDIRVFMLVHDPEPIGPAEVHQAAMIQWPFPELNPDCNENGIPDDEDILSGYSQDCNLNGVPDECDIADGPSEDCNENGIPDECDIDTGFSLDCNYNGVPDDCDIDAGTVEDCNANDIPDDCDVLDTHNFNSGPLIPFGGLGNEQSYTIVQPAEAEGDVTLSFAAYTDLDKTTEYVDVDLNGWNLGSIWVNDGHDCPAIPDTAEIIVTAENWNIALSVGGGDAVINMNPSTGVWANQCPEDSYVIVDVLYFTTSDNDANGNGIPDECECPHDLTGDSTVNIDDIFAVLGLWGPCADPCPPYCEGDITQDCHVNIDDIFAILGAWGDCE